MALRRGWQPPPLEASPLIFSDVKLTGDWADMQNRNQEVLTSLNMSQWSCHFTTTANLSSCHSSEQTWQSYIKNSSASTGFTHEFGFLAAGDDLAPPATTSFTKCEANCAVAQACLGITFESNDPTPATGEEIKCFLKKTIHFTPQHTSSNCVSPGVKGTPL